MYSGNGKYSWIGGSYYKLAPMAFMGLIIVPIGYCHFFYRTILLALTHQYRTKFPVPTFQ